ncbi:MAG: ATP-dependent DNA helicase [Candidatus Marinimicrobia bacterium]|nr:ATP-dependent DNA helicase [Candidatus Neomarinimicrobiota bacterium]
MPYTVGNFKATPSQESAIIHQPAPLMILAGAGTGKTTTLIHRIIYLIQHHKADPQSILAITYTEKAARELKERIVSVIGQRADKMTVSTFHAFCFNLVKDFKQSGSTPILIEESEAAFLLLNRFNDLGPFQSREFPRDPARAVTESFIPFFNRTRDELLEPYEKPSDLDSLDAEICAQLSDLKRIYPIFQQWKKEMNVVDYGDMILTAFRFLNSDLFILQKVQEKFQHIIIDEFQDNNFALNAVSNLIAKRHRQITVVGDEDQVIYSFRGASIHNIHLFREQYKSHPNYLEIALEENFRSNQEILDVANASIKNNVDRVEKSLQSFEGKIDQKPILYFSEKIEQNQTIVNEINTITDGGRSFNDIAVLCRTHGQASDLTAYLQLFGIPVQARYPRFFDITSVKDLNAWCQVIGGGKYQDIGFYRLLTQISTEQDVNEFFNQFDRKDSSSRLEYALVHFESNPIKGMKNLCKIILSLREHPKPQSAEEVINSILEKTTLLRPYNHQYTFDDQVALMNGGLFIQKVQEFSRRNPGENSLRNFNIFMEALMASGKISARFPEDRLDFNAVTVQTIHGVKGGEFPIVFIPYNRSASFPLNYRSQKKINRPPDEWLDYIKDTDLTRKEHHIEEERRLFYVAITRAQEQLFLLAPKRATSPFIKELPESLMEIIDMDGANHTPQPYSTLRSEYEQRLQKALSQNHFDKIANLTDAISRIHTLENEGEISWGDSPWEKELQNKLKGDFHPSASEQLYLSASSIETYQSCPMKYRLAKMDSIPESQSKPQLVFGNIIHRTLQRFHDQQETHSKERLLQLMDEEWDSSGFFYPDQEKEFKLQGEEILNRYFSAFEIDPPHVIAREEKFNFMIEDIKISGAIDRIDKTDTGTQVVDYKTSSTTSSAKSNMQLAIYSIYLEQSDNPEFGGLPESASLYFLREEEKPVKSHCFKPDELLAKEEEIKSVAQGIRKCEFKPTTGHHCDWCDYKNFICPAWEE